MPAPGRLLALEGIDGCGKSTQARALATALGARLTHEPGATALGVALRRLLLAPDAPPISLRAEALLMAADRAEHVAAGGRAGAGGRGVGGERPLLRVDAGVSRLRAWARCGRAAPGWSNWATAGLAADLSILVDVPVDVAQARLAETAPDRLERLGPAFAQLVRDGFLALAAADPAHWVVVDGTTDPTCADRPYPGHRARASRRAGRRARSTARPMTHGTSGSHRPAAAFDDGGGPGAGGGRPARRRRPTGARLPLPGRGGKRRPGGRARVRGRRSCAPTAGAGPARPAGPRCRAATPIST